MGDVRSISTNENQGQLRRIISRLFCDALGYRLKRYVQIRYLTTPEFTVSCVLLLFLYSYSEEKTDLFKIRFIATS